MPISNTIIDIIVINIHLDHISIRALQIFIMDIYFILFVRTKDLKQALKNLFVEISLKRFYKK